MSNKFYKYHLKCLMLSFAIWVQKANTLFWVAKLRHLFEFTKFFLCQFFVK